MSRSALANLRRRIEQAVVEPNGLSKRRSRFSDVPALWFRRAEIAHFEDDVVDIRLTRLGIRRLAANERDLARSVRKDWLAVPLTSETVETIIKLIERARQLNAWRTLDGSKTNG